MISSSRSRCDRIRSAGAPILAAHPEVAKLFVTDPLTAFITLGVVIGQTAIAGYLGHLGLGYWWLTLIVAYFVGAFANHAMFVVIHDAVHNTIFKTPDGNKWVAILADLPNAFPTAMGFRCYHQKHHSHLGDYEYDADLPGHLEAKLAGNRWYGKAFWLFGFAFWQLSRLGRLKGTVPIWGKWTYINTVAVIAYDVAVLYFFGWNALFYLFASSGFRWSPPARRALDQEHFTFDPHRKPTIITGRSTSWRSTSATTTSTTTFPKFPWRLLPELKRMAPEFYDNLKAHKSLTKLFLTFIFDPRYTLYSRVDRSILRRANEASAATR